MGSLIILFLVYISVCVRGEHTLKKSNKTHNSSSQNLSQEYSRVMLLEIFKFGARAPSYLDLIFEQLKQFEPQEIYPNGLRQQYNLGSFLSTRYSDIFGDDKNSLASLISVLSSENSSA